MERRNGGGAIWLRYGELEGITTLGGLVDTLDSLGITYTLKKNQVLIYLDEERTIEIDIEEVTIQ